VDEDLEHVAEARVPKIVAKSGQRRAKHVAVSYPEFRLMVPEALYELVGEKSRPDRVEETVVGRAWVDSLANTQLLDLSHTLEDPRVNHCAHDLRQMDQAMHRIVRGERLLQEVVPRLCRA